MQSLDMENWLIIICCMHELWNNVCNKWFGEIAFEVLNYRLKTCKSEADWLYGLARSSIFLKPSHSLQADLDLHPQQSFVNRDPVLSKVNTIQYNKRQYASEFLKIDKPCMVASISKWYLSGWQAFQNGGCWGLLKNDTRVYKNSKEGRDVTPSTRMIVWCPHGSLGSWTWRLLLFQIGIVLLSIQAGLEDCCFTMEPWAIFDIYSIMYPMTFWPNPAIKREWNKGTAHNCAMQNWNFPKDNCLHWRNFNWA